MSALALLRRARSADDVGRGSTGLDAGEVPYQVDVFASGQIAGQPGAYILRDKTACGALEARRRVLDLSLLNLVRG